MESTSTTLPVEAIVAATAVLLYSLICLGSGIVLFLMLFYHGEQWSYATLIAISVTCSTFSNTVGQLYFLGRWHEIKITEYEQAKLSLEYPAIALGSLATGFRLFLSRFATYCFNVDSLLVLFWAIALMTGIYNIRPKSIASWQPIGLTSKIAAALLPIVAVTVPRAPELRKSFIPSLVVSCAPMLLGFVLGSICILFIVAKYVRAKQMFDSHQTYRSGGLSVDVPPTPGSKGPMSQKTQFRIDRWLLLRFIICFVILSGFEVTVIVFEWTRYNKAQTLAARSSPDFSTRGILSSIFQSISGVSCSLVAFLIFGTTKMFRTMYADKLRGCVRSRRHHDSADFQMVSSKSTENV